MHHIRDCLPSLKTRINQMVSHFQTLVNSFGEPIEDKVDRQERERDQKVFIIPFLIHRVNFYFKSSLNLHQATVRQSKARRRISKCPNCSYCREKHVERSRTKMVFRCGGARICYIFHETFARALESINPLDTLTTFDILTAIRNATVVFEDEVFPDRMQRRFRAHDLLSSSRRFPSSCW